MSFDRLWKVLDRLTIVAMLAASAMVMRMATAPKAESPSQSAAKSIVKPMTGQLAADVVVNAASEGSKDAKTVLVEFSDYHCPFCGRHADNVEDGIRRNFVTTGKVRHLFFNFPLETLHPQAAKVAEGAECAGRQGRFWEMHDRLFVHQQDLTIATVRGLGESMTLDQSRFLDCFNNGETMTKIQADLKLGRMLNVRSTPTFMIGRSLPDGSVALQQNFTGAISYDIFEQILEEAVKAQD